MVAPANTVDDSISKKQRAIFESAIASLEAQISNVGAHLSIDSSARIAYASEIKRMAEQLRSEAAHGRITWAHAAQQAQETRNLVMQIIRSRSTPVGRSMAQRMKATGYTLNELVARQTKRIYGESALFSRLSSFQKNKIYASIVTSAGKSNIAVTTMMKRLSYAGRGVLIIALSVSVYNIATAKNKMAATGKELVMTGAGIGGGIAGGAIAGLACGPGAPVCVTLGAFIGGTLAALGLNTIW